MKNQFNIIARKDLISCTLQIRITIINYTDKILKKVITKDYRITFFERYESKISKWEDKADNMTSKVYNPGTHPDKALQIFDKALQYLSDEALPFFKEKEEYYGPEIIDDYNSMIDSIKEGKENFKENEYDEMLIEYNNYIAEKNKLKQIKKEVKAKIKKENIMKRSDLMKCFDKEDAALVRRSLKEFADKDIIEIYKDGSRYMIKFL